MIIELLNDFIHEHIAVSITAIVGIFILFGAAIWWGAKTYYGLKHKVDNLPCKSNEDKIDAFSNRHGEVERSVVQVKTAIEYIQKSIENLAQSIQNSNKGIMTDPFTQTHSPLSLTKKGEEMVNELGIRHMIDKEWGRISSYIKENASSLNPYDIQQFCIEQAVVYPEKFLCQEDLEKLKNEAYQAGLSLTSYMRVVAVLCRDRYFTENNIDVNEVDANDPRIKDV